MDHFDKQSTPLLSRSTLNQMWLSYFNFSHFVVPLEGGVWYQLISAISLNDSQSLECRHMKLSSRTIRSCVHTQDKNTRARERGREKEDVTRAYYFWVLRVKETERQAVFSSVGKFSPSNVARLRGFKHIDSFDCIAFPLSPSSSVSNKLFHVISNGFRSTVGSTVSVL